MGARVAAVLERFCAHDPGRSAGARVLSGAATGVEISVRGWVPRPGARVLKLPLAIAAHRRGDRWLDDRVAREALPESVYPNVLAAFDPGRALSRRELCALSLITSDNAAASHLLTLVGADGVNEELRALGCRATRIVVGFEDRLLGPPGRANVISADDALRLLARVYEDPALAGVEHALRNTILNQRIPLLLPDDVAVAHKTGSLDGVVNDVGIVYGQAGDVALAFLCDGQGDAPTTEVAIGRCAADIRQALGQQAHVAAAAGGDS